MPVTLSAPPVPPAPLAPPHKKWTREECAVLESVGLLELRRYELIEGELVQKVSKNYPHMRVLLLLVNWLRLHFAAECVLQEPSIDVAPEDTPASEPEPDAVVLSRSFLDITSRPRPEDIHLVVEVSDSTLAFDLTTKALLYARAAIPEYWVFEVAGRRIIVHRDPIEGQYCSVVAYSDNETVSCLAAPHVEVRPCNLL
jgi:Uma2 family endonuclease